MNQGRQVFDNKGAFQNDPDLLEESGNEGK